MPTLFKIWIKAVIILLLISSTVPSASASLLRQLLFDYQKYELPLPSPTSKLVVVNHDKSAIPYLGFSESGVTNPFVLIGPVHHQFDQNHKISEVDPVKVDLDYTHLSDPSATPFQLNYGLLMAIQCEAHELHDLALQLLDRSLAGHVDYSFIHADELHRANDSDSMSPKTQLWYSAWHYRCSELVKLGTDRAVIRGQMESLFELAPQEVKSKTVRGLLNSLRETLTRKDALPGSPEDLINQLTEYGNWHVADPNNDSFLRPPLQPIVEVGFEAIPALIKHLEDARLSRLAGPMACGGWCPPFIFTVGDHVEQILFGLIGWDDKRFVDIREQKAKISLVHQWWLEAKTVGEEAYLLNRVLSTNSETRSINELLLDIIAKKYSWHLPMLYKKILDEYPNVGSARIVSKIANGSLPNDQKMELFTYAVRHKKWGHRSNALSAIHKLDPNRFANLLTGVLEEMQFPKETPWDSSELSCANLVCRTDDSTTWDAFERLGKRSNVRLRTELLKRLYNKCEEPGFSQKQRVKLLTAFLNDTSLGELAGFSSEPVLWKFPSVQNLAALRIGQILLFSELPSENWSEDQWKTFREKARVESERILKP